MASVFIESAVRSDFSAIARLQADSWRSAYRNHLPATYLADRVELDLQDDWKARRIGGNDVVLVARQREGGPLLGFIAVWCRSSPYIDNLHCEPNHTSLGIGTMLMRTAFERLLEKGHNTASLSVLVGNDGARRFYLRLGGLITSRCRETIFGYPVDVEKIWWDNLQAALPKLIAPSKN